VCQSEISQITILNSLHLTESTTFPIGEFLDSSASRGGSSETCSSHPDQNLFDSFDHYYFEQEIKNLIHLTKTVEHERFHSRRNFKNYTSSRELEWQSL
jgi:hypothetical protein